MDVVLFMVGSIDDINRLMWWEGGAWSDVESTQAKKRERIPETGM